METPPPCDIREIRPDEAPAAVALFDGGPTLENLQRRLSVGAFDLVDGTLLGAAVNEVLDSRGCVVHLYCDDPSIGRSLLDRALQKAAASGHRTSQVALHPEATARAVWSTSSWPVRASTNAEQDSASHDEQPQSFAEPATDSQPQVAAPRDQAPDSAVAPAVAPAAAPASAPAPAVAPAVAAAA